jgi:ABC-type multidrug transport system fused ATPase/permease subunit
MKLMMRTRESVSASLALLTKRDRRFLLLVVLIQFLLSLLDLAGIILLGVVVTISVAAFSGDSTPGGSIGTIVDYLPKGTSFIIFLGVMAGLALVAKSLFGMFLTRRTFQFLANRQAIISGSIARRLLSQPLLFVQRRSSQQVSVALTSGVSALTLGILGPATVIAAEVSLVTVLFVGLLVVDPAVALFSLVFFGLLALLLHLLLGPWSGRLGTRYSLAEIESLAQIQHAMRAYREIAVLGRREHFASRFQSLRWESAGVIADQFILGQIGKYVFEIGLVIGGGLLVLLVTLTQDTVAGVGVISIFLVASARLFPSLLRLQSSSTNIRGASGTGAVTLGLLADLDEAESDGAKDYLSDSVIKKLHDEVGLGYPDFDPSLRVTDVSLRYPGAATLALDSVTFETQSNCSLALVGATGAGKSTLADAILGVLLPDVGTVSISGVEPHECVDRWPGAMAYVPQDVAVLSGTVRDNVALGIPTDFIDDSLVWEALERAQLSTFLQESRDGIATIVGENGVQLSGGQRQRLGIARALYSRPKLLVLDEATSSLDAETERIITETLDSLGGDVTLIVIAHRLATVRHFDQVIHLSEGRITGRGTFEEVRAQVPEFNRQAELLGL